MCQISRLVAAYDDVVFVQLGVPSSVVVFASSDVGPEEDRTIIELPVSVTKMTNLR